MDGDSYRKTKKNKKKKSSNPMSNDGNVHKSIGIRCASSLSDEVDRKLLDYSRYFLLPCGVILWALYMAFGL